MTRRNALADRCGLRDSRPGRIMADMEPEIVALDAELAETAFGLATRVFVEASTLHAALGVGLEAYRDQLRAPFRAMVAEGLSVAARDRASGALVGCLLAGDYHGHLQGKAVTGPPGLAPVAALTAALRRAYPRRIGPGEALLVDMAAVDPAAGGRGIYRRMRQAVERRARERGFARIVGELSSSITQRLVLERLGHRKLAEIRFADFAFAGGRPFLAITEPDAIVLAEGDL